MPINLIFDLFHWVNIAQKYENQQMVTKIQPLLKAVRLHQHAKSQANSAMRSMENTWKLKFYPFHDVKIAPELCVTKIFCLFWSCWAYINIPNIRPLFPFIILIIPGNHKFDPSHQIKVASKIRKSVGRDQYILFNSKGGQDAKFRPVPSRKNYPEAQNLTCFIKFC